MSASRLSAAPSLLPGLLDRHVPSIARAITVLENRGRGFAELLAPVWAAGGKARIVGITGAPGSGKSTLVAALVAELRARDRSVAVVAVDPSSTLTGGAILGDRIRMGAHNGDAGVYVRSMSNRGSLGGVSRATVEAVAVLDAAGFDDVIVETVGVGQAEVDIVGIAQTVVVVSVPGLGDDVQMIKAGLLEIADVHAVNKADRPDANKTVAELRSMLTLNGAPGQDEWAPPIVETAALEARGLDELANAFDAHDVWLSGPGRRAARHRVAVEARVREITKELVVETLQDVRSEVGFSNVIDAVAARAQSPYDAARQLIAGLVDVDRARMGAAS